MMFLFNIGPLSPNSPAAADESERLTPTITTIARWLSVPLEPKGPVNHEEINHEGEQLAMKKPSEISLASSLVWTISHLLLDSISALATGPTIGERVAKLLSGSNLSIQTVYVVAFRPTQIVCSPVHFRWRDRLSFRPYARDYERHLFWDSY